MNQWRVILAVAIVAVGSGAIWVWHDVSPDANATPASAKASAPVQRPLSPEAARSVASDAAPVPSSSPPVEPESAASTDNQSVTSAAAEPPNVDTPEPAERKFASVGRAESDQN